MSNKYRLEGESRSFSLKGAGKVLMELIIIVAGIYLAFELEKWGELKADEDLKINYISQLLEEAETNKAELDADQDARKEQLELFGYLLEAPNRQVGIDTLREGVKDLLTIRLFSPTDAVYEDLISSGNLKLIPNNIRKTIIQYKMRLSRAPITEEIEERLIEEKIETYLINEGVLSLLEPLEELDQITVSEQQVNRIVRALLNDREFIDLIYLRYSRLQDVVYFENPLGWTLDELIEQLKAELKTGN